jgi:GNAT superfamily N-acetyltransferase
MTINLKFRSATIDDSDHLVALLDAASRRLVSWFWSTMSEPGQSYFEVGRNRIRTKTESPTYFTNWLIAELEGRIAGALNGYSIAKPYDQGDISELPDVYTPMIELEAVAEGTWYLQVASVYPEFRGKGIGTAILSKAEAIARGSGANRMSLMVESANRDAHRFYGRFGFTDWASRPFIPFPGSSDKGDWILMGKDVDPAG